MNLQKGPEAPQVVRLSRPPPAAKWLTFRPALTAGPGHAKGAATKIKDEAAICLRRNLYQEHTEAVVAKHLKRGVLTQLGGMGKIGEDTGRFMHSPKET